MKLRDRLLHNPFLVLGASPDATRAELERAAQRLLAELVIGREAARRYETPIGPAVRTEELVRAAVAALREPEQRLVHEEWARAAAHAGPHGEPDAAEAPFEGAVGLVARSLRAPKA